MRKVLFIILIGFLIGWIFPVEGPLDSTMYVRTKAPVKRCAVTPSVIMYPYTEEELEEIEEEFRNGFLRREQDE